MNRPGLPLGRLALTALVVESTAVQALASLAQLALPAVAPAVAASLGLPAALVGVQIALGYGGAMATSLIGGSVVRRLGPVRTSQTALLLLAAGALATAMGTLAALAAGALLIGFGYGLVNPAASYLLVKATTPASRNLIFSLKQTGVPLGGMAAGIMAPPIAQHWGWPWAMVTITVIGVVLAALLQPSRKRWDGERDAGARLRGNPLAGLSSVWQVPAIRALSLSGFLYAAVQLSLSTFLVTMLVGELDWPLVEAGLVLAATQVAGAAGRILWGVVADAQGDGIKTLEIIGIISVAAALAVGVIGHDSPNMVVVAVLLLFGLSSIGWNGVFLAELARATPLERVSSVTGLSLFFCYGGVLVGPPTFAALQHAIGSWRVTYGLSALPVAVGVALLWRARRAGAVKRPEPR